MPGSSSPIGPPSPTDRSRQTLLTVHGPCTVFAVSDVRFSLLRSCGLYGLFAVFLEGGPFSTRDDGASFVDRSRVDSSPLVAMSGGAFRERMAALKQRMSDFVAGKPRYAPLEAQESLSEPLRTADAGEDEDEWLQRRTFRTPHRGERHGMNAEMRPDREQTQQRIVDMVPSIEDDLQEVVALAKEASTFLWELLAESGGVPGDEDVHRDVAEELLEQCHLFEKQLRGMIADYNGRDEKLLAESLEANDMLLTVLQEFQENMGKGKSAGTNQNDSSYEKRFRPSPTSGRHHASKNPFAPRSDADSAMQSTSTISPGHQRQDSDPLIEL